MRFCKAGFGGMLKKFTDGDLYHVHVIAFDIDKLHGGIYIVFSDKKFYRIAKTDKDFFGYKVTHEQNLMEKEVLPLGMPLGTCSIVYDSVTGRVIIGDNYKIQALYI